MNVAELFVDLGIKGADATVSSLTDIRKSLGDVSSISLEAKAGIFAIGYGLERLMAQSGQVGTNLTNLSNVTGENTKFIQQWEYAARQAGVSAEDFDNSLKGVKSTVANIDLGKGIPEGFGLVKQLTNLDTSKLHDTEYLMTKLVEAAQKLPPGLGNALLKSFGLTEGFLVAARKNAFDPRTLGRAPTYSERELEQLNRANIAWGNLGRSVEMAIGHFNALHGVELQKDIAGLVKGVVSLSEAFLKLDESTGFLANLGHLLEGIGNTLKLVSEIVNKLGGVESKPGDLLYTPPGQEAIPGLSNSPAGKFFKSLFNDKIFGGSGDFLKDIISPDNNPSSVSQTDQSVTVHQNIVHHGDAKDTQKVKDTHKAAVNAAFRQRPNYVGN